MEFILGFLMCVMFVLSFTLGVYFEKRYNNTSKQIEASKDALREKEEKEARKRQKGFDNIMRYDTDVAMGIKEQVEE